MQSNPRQSHRIRGQSPEFDPITRFRLRHISAPILGTIHTSHSDSDLHSSVHSNIFIQTTPSSSSTSTMAANLGNPAGSTLLGSMYSGYNPIVSANDPKKVIKSYGLFQFEEDLNATPWHVSSPLNLAPARIPLPKFKDYLPKFFGNGTCTVEDHLNAFSNACHNIGANTNDTCMRLFVNSLEGKASSDFFDLPPKSFSTWAELCYWFKSTFGQPQTLVDWLKEYNNLVYQPGESIKTFNL